jgi:hypothetical protein
MEAAKFFKLKHEENETMSNTAITHADNLNAWLYSVKTGLIHKTRYSVLPDDKEVTAFCKEGCTKCIKGVLGHSVSFDSSSVISQLTNAIVVQIEEAMESNNLCHQDIEPQIKNDNALPHEER